MSHEIKIGILLASRQYTEIMRAADIFERFKCIADFNPAHFTVTLKPHTRAERPLRNIVTKLQTGPEFWPVALWCEEPELLWVDPEIKMISTGHQFAMLRDYLRFLGVSEFQILEVPGSKPNGSAIDRWGKPA